jgi:dTDP-D-glucose 4,6-dehydratase
VDAHQLAAAKRTPESIREHRVHFAEGLEQTVAWYEENEAWWTRDKTRTEAAYAELGR